MAAASAVWTGPAVNAFTTIFHVRVMLRGINTAFEMAARWKGRHRMAAANGHG
jgi:hypothetical protein